ncbi:MAG TPA: exo-alpha-sialidase [Planctomicrobium sp.]|nr:exo-alpha-sialidase [Planctomicrobium sp.]
MKLKTQLYMSLLCLGVLFAEQQASAQSISESSSEAQNSNERILWNPQRKLPKADELETVKNVEFSVIKRHEPDVDGGYGFLHGVALCWHKGKLYVSFGHNKGPENTAEEEARGRISTDGGKTWGDVFTIDHGDEPNLAVSHGVFLSVNGRLWAFHGAFQGHLQSTHTRAYVLNETTNEWEKKGIVAREGFWSTQEPIKMEDGNWIMAGMSVPNDFRQGKVPAAVAISHGDDLTRWDVVILKDEIRPEEKIWGESTVIVNGWRVINISRFGSRAIGLMATSDDYGRTWNSLIPSNLPMVTSKPYAGTLSNGQNYLVCTTTANTGGRRAPLTIAVSRPGEEFFSKVFKIRDAVMSEGNTDSHPRGNLSYPYAIEENGKLYIGYSNNGGRQGANINSAELAIIPVSDLRVD